MVSSHTKFLFNGLDDKNQILCLSQRSTFGFENRMIALQTYEVYRLSCCNEKN